MYLTLVSSWTVACKAPLSIRLSRPEYWSGLSFPSPGDLPDPEIEPGSPALQVDSLLTELQEKPVVLELSHQSSLSLCSPMDCSPSGTSVYWNSPGKNIGVGCHALFQGIFPTQGLNSGLLRYRQILYCLNHQGSLFSPFICPGVQLQDHMVTPFLVF